MGLGSLILNKLPQQEIYNKEFLVKNGCAIAVENNSIATNINLILNNKSKLLVLKENCLKLRKPDSLDIFYKEIANFGMANYDGLELKDSKNQMKRKIRNARKNAV